ncbi:hypothetical protein CAC42_8270 [Sphaceloma murrayae]|uniref:NAD-dependent epimerase/dehydratase domain-containing protein n=1 Tax=Sphaceloma murrayae TaxID=2082308 RepID=A0A2K1QK40_9PEZI|nr:hypothetical protein CAC42_8270 [Sphaceloma murrayae]
MPNIFITGVSGYIGGDAFHALFEAHPDYTYTALVRSGPRAAQVAAAYPSLRLVYGDLASVDLIAAEAAAADVVLHSASADDAAPAQAIIKGLASKPEGGFWIHVSGTGLLTFEDIKNETYGKEGGEVFDDWEGIERVTDEIPDEARHRRIDKIVLAAGEQSAGKVKTAIVSPSCIYGKGRGKGNDTSIQVPSLAKVTIERGHGVMINEGKTRWPGIHVADLSDLFVGLVEQAVKGGGSASWGKKGYYFVESEELVWGEVSTWVLDAAKKLGLADTDEVKSLNKDEASQAVQAGHIRWGANSRCKAIRARKLLGWQPRRPRLKDVVAETVEIEARRLGRLPGHAAKAAGDA